MTSFDGIAPTVGDNGNAYEWIWDVAALPAGGLSAITDTDWKNVPDITGLNPSAPPQTQDGTTYANKGNPSQDKIGETFTMPVNVKGVKDTTGEFQPELLILLEAGDAKGAANVIAYRYYHATSATLAYQGTANVEWTRQNTGNTDTEFFSFTLTGRGDRTKITNPAIPVTP